MDEVIHEFVSGLISRQEQNAFANEIQLVSMPEAGKLSKMKPTLLIIVCAVVALTGCATSKIEPTKVGLGSIQISKTDPIYVKDFDASKAVFLGEYSDVPEKVKAQRVRVSQIISLETINHLTENGFTAARFSDPVPSNAIVIEGEVTLVDSGSGAVRFWVGLGAGASKIQANARVYRASEPSKLIADLSMTGSSGGSGGLSGGYKDWIGVSSRDLGVKLGNYLMSVSTR